MQGTVAVGYRKPAWAMYWAKWTNQITSEMSETQEKLSYNEDGIAVCSWNSWELTTARRLKVKGRWWASHSKLDINQRWKEETPFLIQTEWGSVSLTWAGKRNRRMWLLFPLFGQRSPRKQMRSQVAENGASSWRLSAEKQCKSSRIRKRMKEKRYSSSCELQRKQDSLLRFKKWKRSCRKQGEVSSPQSPRCS